MKTTVAAYVADFLTKQDITHCFCVTGGGAMHLNMALGRAPHLHTVYNHHEQASAMAAEAYTRLSGKLCAVCVTSGPGGINALTGVMGGYLDSIPMLILSGQVKRAHLTKSSTVAGLRQLGDQEFDIVSTVRTMTKYAAVIEDPSDIAYHLEHACHAARTGRGGPVWLDIPLDVQAATVETADLRHAAGLDDRTPCVSPTTGEEILHKIQQARAPLLLVGTGVRLGCAVPLLSTLLQKLQIPVVTAWNAEDCVPYDSPFFAGMPGTVGTRAGNFAVQNCDLLLTLGCRLNIRMVGHNLHEFAKNAFHIMVDIDEKELKKHTVRVDMPICADVHQLLSLLLSLRYTPSPRHEPWLRHCKELLARYPAIREAIPTKTALNPYVWLDELFARLDENDTVVCGNGSACVMTFQAAKMKHGQRLFTNSGCAAMGYGLPAALGAAFAAPTRRTVLIDGDGSIMMNLQELATLAHHRPNVKIFLFNNGGYHSIRQTQAAYFAPPVVGCGVESGLSFPDFGVLAKAFGLPFARIRDAACANELIEDVLSANGPILCEVMLDRAQPFAPKTAAKVLPDGTMHSAALDDMAPFLSQEALRAARYQGYELC